MRQSQKLRHVKKRAVRSEVGQHAGMTAKITGVVSYSLESWYHKPWNPGILSHGILRFDDVSLVSYPMERWYLIPWRSGILWRGISNKHRRNSRTRKSRKKEISYFLDFSFEDKEGSP